MIRVLITLTPHISMQRQKRDIRWEEYIYKEKQRSLKIFVNEFLDEIIRNSIECNSENAFEIDQHSSAHYTINVSISIGQTIHKHFMNLFFLSADHHIYVLDCGSDTCVVGVDHETAV